MMRLSPLVVPAVLFSCAIAYGETPKMGRDAFSRVDLAARVLSGHAVLVSGFKPDGTVFRFITSGYAPLYGETDAQRKARLAGITDEKWERWLAYLARLADADGSGVVDAQEGKALKDTVYFGITAAQLSKVKSFEVFEDLMDEDEGVVAAALERYPALQAAAERDGMLGLPRLPDHLRRPNRGAASARARPARQRHR